MPVSQKPGDVCTDVLYHIKILANLIIKQNYLNTVTDNFMCFGASFTFLCTAHCLGFSGHCYNSSMLELGHVITLEPSVWSE